MVGVTGAAPARIAQFEEVEDSLPLIEAARVALVLLVVAVAFRSVGAALVTLFTAAIAYLVMIRVLAWLGERGGVVVPGEVEPALLVLLLGLVTDYSVFFLSGFRRRLRRDTGAHVDAFISRRVSPTAGYSGSRLAAGGAATVQISRPSGEGASLAEV